MKTQHPPESMNRETLHFFSPKGRPIPRAHEH
jgi:hypothetical protein